MRGDPGAGLALRQGDLDLGHQLGDLAAQLDGFHAALQGGEVEPFMRGDEIDTPERPLAQYRPRSNNTSGIAVACTGIAVS